MKKEKQEIELLEYYQHKMDEVEGMKGFDINFEKMKEEITLQNELAMEYMRKIPQSKELYQHILRDLGLDDSTLSFGIIAEVASNVVLTRPRVLLELIGDEGSGKTFAKQDILGILSKFGEISSAQLYGSKASYANMEEKVILEEDVVNLDEFQEGNMKIEDLKRVMTISSFEKSGKIPRNTTTSFLLSYNDFSNPVCSIHDTLMLQGKYRSFMKDRAFIDRISGRIPYFKALLKRKYNSSYQKNNLSLKYFLLSRRGEKVHGISEHFSIREIQNARERECIKSMVEGMLLIFYLKVELIPNYAITACIEFAKYFRSLSSEKIESFHYPFNRNSLRFLLWLHDFDISNFENPYFYFDKLHDRLVIYEPSQETLTKIALTGAGFEKNREEIKRKEYKTHCKFSFEAEKIEDFKIIKQILPRGYRLSLESMMSCSIHGSIIPEKLESLALQKELNLEKLEKWSLYIQNNIIIPEKFEGISPLMKLEIQAELLKLGIDINTDDIPENCISFNEKQEWKIIDLFFHKSN